MSISEARPTVAFDRVSKRFRRRVAVDDVSWGPQPGQVTALVGLNGAGKSTIMRVASDLVRPTSGNLSRTDPGTSSARSRSWTAMIEAPALFDGLSVRRNLAIHAVLTGASFDNVNSVVGEARIGSILAQRAGKLSQGYRQRVALAIALLANPRVVFLDEPTNALDPESIVDLRRLIRVLADRGACVVVSSHLLRELEGVADRLLVMNEGRILFDGTFEAFVGPGSIRVRPLNVTDRDQVKDLVNRLGQPVIGDEEGVSVVVEGSNPEAVAAMVARGAATEGIILVELAYIRPSLEERFHTMIGQVAA